MEIAKASFHFFQNKERRLICKRELCDLIFSVRVISVLNFFPAYSGLSVFDEPLFTVIVSFLACNKTNQKSELSNNCKVSRRPVQRSRLVFGGGVYVVRISHYDTGVTTNVIMFIQSFKKITMPVQNCKKWTDPLAHKNTSS
jgi:hypothetical protein